MKKPRGIDPTTDQLKVGEHWIPTPEAMARIFRARHGDPAALGRWSNYDWQVRAKLEKWLRESKNDPR